MQRLVYALMVAVLGVVAACANAQPSDALSLSTDAVTLAAGRTADVMATDDAGGEVTWASDAPAIVTVTAGADGAATIVAVAKGHATVSAMHGQLARSLDVTVTDAELDAIDISAARDTVPRGLTLQLTATGTYSDKHTDDLTAQVTWGTSDAAVATVDAAGLVTAVGVGAGTATATLGGVHGAFDLTVSSAALAAIALAPAQPVSLAKGRTQALAVTGTYTDQTTGDVTPLVTWSTSDASIATVDGTGLATAVAGAGTATITATAGTLTATIAITDLPAALDAIAVTPAPLALALGRDQALVATGTYSDHTTADVTATAAWTIATGTAVTVSTAGVAHAAAQGTATVRAAIGAIAGTLDVTVGPAVVDHLALSAGDLTLAQHQRARVKAALVYSDATTFDVTATATWSATGTSATVTAGVIDAGATAGATTITASASGASASLVATVTTAACHVVINEIQAGGASAGDEWVELYNPCTTSFDVSTWTLVYRAASTVSGGDTNTLQALAGTMAAGDLRLYVGPGYTGAGTPDGTAWGGASGLLQGTNGGIGLRAGPKDTGPLVDAVAYGTVTAGHPFLEGTAGAPALANGKSVARGPVDGYDTDHNSIDFALVAAPTPRALNH